MADVVAVALGAALALGAQSFLQLYVVPRVDARKRREDRWEKDVRDFGTILSGEVPKVATDARRAQRFLAVLADAFNDDKYNHERLEEAHKKQTEEARSLSQAFQDTAVTKLDWLAGQIREFDPEAAAIARFWVTWELYEMTADNAHFLPWAGESPSETQVDALWTREAERREALTHALQTLRAAPAPPRTSRIKRRLKISLKMPWLVRARRSGAQGSPRSPDPSP